MKTEESRRKFYNNVKAGAESGWDFSARWFIARNGTASLELADIATENVIPVDLNAFLEKNARTLARFFKIKNNTQVLYTGRGLRLFLSTTIVISYRYGLTFSIKRVDGARTSNLLKGAGS